MGRNGTINAAATLVRLNKHLAAERDRLVAVVDQQNGMITAMNKTLSQIARLVGAPVPTGNEKPGEVIAALINRVQELADKGKDAAQTSMERSE